MIRINLLPVRAAKKKESVRFQLTVAGLVIFLALVASIGVYIAANSEAKAVQADINSGNEELARLKRKIGELSRIKQQKKVVEEKLKIIKDLEAARTGPLKVFNLIDGTIPEKAWIKTMRDSGAVITLNGFAESEDVVADFMRRLQQKKGPNAVDLEIVKSEKESETKANVVSFAIRIRK